jgi:hypothetical protein
MFVLSALGAGGNVRVTGDQKGRLILLLIHERRKDFGKV